jgi:hypothetical protein
MTTAMTQTTVPLVEILNREDPSGKLLPFINLLARTDQLLSYVDWTKCNANLSHKGVRVSTEPTPSDGAYDKGCAPTYGTTEPYEEPTTMMTDWVVTDRNKLQDRGSGREAWLNAEAKLHFNGFKKAFGDRTFYGDKGTYPLRLRGFTFRSAYNTLSSAYVFDNSGGNASATVNKTSAWLIRTGPEYFQFTYPENDAGTAVPDAGDNSRFPVNQAMGFTTIDYGLLTASDGTYEYPAYKTWWQWRWGMVVHDPRAISRQCNISCTNIDSVDDFGFNHLYMIDMLGAFLEYFGDLQNTVIVVPTIVHTQIAKEIDQKSNVYGTLDDPFGRPISSFNYDGVKVPICTCNSIKGPHSDAMEAKVS